MKIALPHLNGLIFPNLTRTGQFIIYDVVEKEIVSSRLLFIHGQGANGIAELLAEAEVELVLCKEAGKRGLAVLDEECIEVVENFDGTTEEAVRVYLTSN